VKKALLILGKNPDICGFFEFITYGLQSDNKNLTKIKLPGIDGLVKSLKISFSVIPAKAGIQSFQIVINSLDSGFHLSARHRQAGETTFYEAIGIDLFHFSGEGSLFYGNQSYHGKTDQRP